MVFFGKLILITNDETNAEYLIECVRKSNSDSQWYISSEYDDLLWSSTIQNWNWIKILSKTIPNLDI